MRFVFGKNDWKDFERGQENCYLLTNGLGGFSSLTMIGSSARNDQALLMAAVKAPNERWNLLSNLEETLWIQEKPYVLSSQEYVNRTKNQTGFEYLNCFTYDYLPQWTYQVGGTEIIKTIVMVQGENTVGIHYRFLSRGMGKRAAAGIVSPFETNSNMSFSVRPWFQFAPKGQQPETGQKFQLLPDCVESQGLRLHFQTNGTVIEEGEQICSDLYYEQDARDGRGAVGTAVSNHRIVFELKEEEQELFLLYTLQPASEISSLEKLHSFIEEEILRQKNLEEAARIKDPVGRHLVKSANQYVSYRASTQGKTILAGFPFFEDWGRDTMIALVGCTITARQFEDAKSILSTFMKYCQRGLMPNLFPEGGKEPFYNTVDAALLFVEAIYEYYKVSRDLEFVKEAYPIMEDIISWYKRGTDYHIKMDEDGLIMAGAGLEQVTWMDVRIGDILPTPRHGKPVEINAYWYNALMVMAYFSEELGKDREVVQNYENMAKRTKQSFLYKFWDSAQLCLKDLAEDEVGKGQIRPNQIWAASMPFSMLNEEQANLVIQKVYEELYTPYGLRSLSPKDKEFAGHYGGSQLERDLAYHQGTVWAFPLGAYYLAYLRWAEDKGQAKKTVKRQLEPMMACLEEGCIGHIAEIYDGKTPTRSNGCFAQAWSVGEILRVYSALEQ